MPMAVISGEAERAIRRNAVRDYVEPARNPDGTYTVWLSEETVIRLSQCHMSGEELSDTLIRLMALSRREVN
jgi:hypothetical protein